MGRVEKQKGAFGKSWEVRTQPQKLRDANEPRIRMPSSDSWEDHRAVLS